MMLCHQGRSVAALLHYDSLPFHRLTSITSISALPLCNTMGIHGSSRADAEVPENTKSGKECYGSKHGHRRGKPMLALRLQCLLCNGYHCNWN